MHGWAIAQRDTNNKPSANERQNLHRAPPAGSCMSVTAALPASAGQASQRANASPASCSGSEGRKHRPLQSLRLPGPCHHSQTESPGRRTRTASSAATSAASAALQQSTSRERSEVTRARAACERAAASNCMRSLPSGAGRSTTGRAPRLRQWCSTSSCTGGGMGPSLRNHRPVAADLHGAHCQQGQAAEQE